MIFILFIIFWLILHNTKIRWSCDILFGIFGINFCLFPTRILSHRDKDVIQKRLVVRSYDSCNIPNRQRKEIKYCLINFASLTLLPQAIYLSYAISKLFCILLCALFTNQNIQNYTRLNFEISEAFHYLILYYLNAKYIISKKLR